MMESQLDLSALIRGLRKGDQRAIARAITLLENRPELQEQILRALKPAPHAKIIGFTGSPGSGKSTIVNQLTAHIAAQGVSVAVVAVDPSSPFSGGALLGDRVRMELAEKYPQVFIRSLASRGIGGGLSQAASVVCELLKRVGFRYIIVETVGVGQVEVDVVRLADRCVVVLVPGMGDSVQALKAGILEIADIYVVNKADLPGADATIKDLRLLISLGETSAARKKNEVPILSMIAKEGKGISELWRMLSLQLKQPQDLEYLLLLSQQRLSETLGSYVWQRLKSQYPEQILQASQRLAHKKSLLYEEVQKLFIRLTG